MKTNLHRAALGCVMLLAATAMAQAEESPTRYYGATIQVVLLRVPGGGGAPTVISKGLTDENGGYKFSNLVPGTYEMDIDGPSFVAAMDRNALPAPEKKSGGLSVGIGGGFFGGSSHSSSPHQGAGPAGPSGGGSQTGSGGGMAMGVSVPIGGNEPVPHDNPITAITITLPANPDAYAANGSAGTVLVSIDAPYCRDAAIRGMHIGFKVPDGPQATAVMTIFDRWGNL